MEKKIYSFSFLSDYILNLSNYEKDLIVREKHDIYEKCIIYKHGKRREVYILKGEDGVKIKAIQRKLVEEYLTKLDLPYPVKGFKKGQSYKNFLSEHIGNNFFLRLDIKNFFQSIDTKKFTREFSNIININDNYEKEKAMKLIENICFYNGTLPQGACSSPAMSNVIFSRNDQRILKYCQKRGVEYTRYADDLLFSSDKLDFKKEKWFIKKIKHILYDTGYKLNYKKILYSTNGELNLNGYILNNREVRLSRKRFKHIYSIINTVNNVLNIERDKKRLNMILTEFIFNEKMSQRGYTCYKFYPDQDKEKIKGVNFYFSGENDNNDNCSDGGYNFIFIDKIILEVITLSIEKNGRYKMEDGKLVFYKNKGEWEYPKYKFESMNAIVTYLLGQRSHLISWITQDNTFNQRRIRKVISKIEDVVDEIDKIYS